MNRFENGKHLANYILKVLRNTTTEITKEQESTIKNFKHVYDFVEFYVDIVECPVTFNSSLSNWIDYAKSGNIKKLCEIVETSLQKIPKFKSKEISFDSLFSCLDLDIRYRCGYLETRPANDDIYYPFKLPIIVTKIRNSKGALYCYSKPNKELNNNYGCYLIYDYEDKDKIIYVGKSNANLLYRACSSARDKADGKFSKVELLEMPSHADTNIYEMYYIAKYKPQCNTDSVCEDHPTFELPDIATHHTIELVKEDPFEIKQLCFSVEYVTKEEFWSNGNYLLYTEKNIENKKLELTSNIHGIVDGTNIYSIKDLYEKDGYLCTFIVEEKYMKSI